MKVSPILKYLSYSVFERQYKKSQTYKHGKPDHIVEQSFLYLFRFQGSVLRRLDREMTVGRVLTCTADALVLCSLPVTSPRCLQGQSWDTKRRETRLDLCISMLVWNRSWTFLIFRPKVYCNVGCCLPISGFFASSASSVLKRVFGKRMKIFDLSKCDSSFINSLMVNYLLLLQDCYQTLIPPLSRLLSSPPSNTLPS